MIAEQAILARPSEYELVDRWRHAVLISERRAARSHLWLPLLSLLEAAGLLLVVLGYAAARLEAAEAPLLFWSGLLGMFVPAAARLASSSAARQERMALLVLLGLGLYLVKLLQSPLDFTYSDEFAHARTVNDIVQSGRLFSHNPLITVSPLFPGLEVITSALVSVGSFSTFAAGGLAIAAARLLHVLALYLFYEQVCRSPRVAGLAALLYMANPNFVFFEAQFSYESLALPLATFTLFAVARRESIGGRGRVGLTLVALLALAAVVATHHLTAYILATFLIVWALVAATRQRSSSGQPGVDGVAVLAVVGALSWLLYVASLVVGYLAPNLFGGATELLRLIGGETTGRQLFRSFSGEEAPLWEQLTGYASVGLILVVLPFGLLRILRQHRDNAIALTLALGAMAYPASLGLRLTQRGAEASNRASEFLFLAVAFVLAVAATECWLKVCDTWKGRYLLGIWATVLFAGGVILGWPSWARLPGPYLVGADMRSIEPQGVAAAGWARVNLGPGARVAADRTNRLLMGYYGEQRPITGYGDNVDESPVFFAPELGKFEIDTLQQGQVRYLVVDQRLTSGLPMVGVYFEQGEPNTFAHRTPIDPQALAKFDRAKGVNRIFDSGDISIFDVGALR